MLGCEARGKLSDMRVSQNRAFRVLWVAEAISGTGSAISIIIVPIFAVTKLGASTAEMGLLTAATIAPGIIAGLLVAPHADSTTNPLGIHRLLEVAVGLTTFAIPLLWWNGQLSMLFLVTGVSIVSALQRASLSYRGPYVALAIPKEHIVEAQGHLQGLASASGLAGQASATALLKIVAAPVALCIDAASSLIGAVVLRYAPKSAPSRIGHLGVPGLQGSARLSLLRRASELFRTPEVASVCGVAFLGGASQTVLAVLAIRKLGLSSTAFGGLLVGGAIGGVLGGAATGRLQLLLGRRVFLVTAALQVLSVLPLAAVSVGGIVGGLAVLNLELLGSFGGTIMVASALGRLQASAADGSVASTLNIAYTIMQGGAIAGVIAAIVVASRSSERAVLVLAVVPLVLVSFWLLLGEMRTRDSTGDIEKEGLR